MTAAQKLKERLARLPEPEREERAREWLAQLDAAHMDSAIDEVTSRPGAGTPHPETEEELGHMLEEASARCAAGQGIPLEEVISTFRRRHGLA